MGNVQNHCWRKWPSAFRAVSSPRAARELNNAWMTLKIVVRRTNMVCKLLHVKVFNLVLYWARKRVLLRGIQPNEKHSPYGRSKMNSYAIYNDNLLTATVFSSQNDYTIHDSVLSVNVVPQKCTRWAIYEDVSKSRGLLRVFFLWEQIKAECIFLSIVVPLRWRNIYQWSHKMNHLRLMRDDDIQVDWCQW